MKYKRFEEVPVWQQGINLTATVFKVTRDSSFRGQGDIANQIQRASLSIPNNIAEGFERGTTSELIQFLYYAKGSAGEVRSICYVIEKIEIFQHLKSQISDIKKIADSISRQLAAWLFSLQESDITGHRHLTAQSKAAWQQKKRSEKFLNELKKRNKKINKEREEEKKTNIVYIESNP